MPLIWNPDKNNDGKVGFREAYLYADMEAYARGVPRSTSEYFLELWEPWYVKWTPFDLADADNEYRIVATSIAEKLAINPMPGQDGFTDAVQSSLDRAKLVHEDIHGRLENN